MARPPCGGRKSAEEGRCRSNEVHLESWLRGPQNEWLTYRELARNLVEYVRDLGYTHIELLPIMEHPFSGSWGYQVTGYYTPTARFGTPEDFMYFVDTCHQNGIGVIVDWVPAHFPKDAHGLAFFDGTALYEHADPRKGEHKDWGTLIFNFGRNEVMCFLISNAMFWLKKYHIDGLRVDAVASMLYLDYSRKEGEWIPNIYGGNENLEAVAFLRRFNELAHSVPGAVTIAEESTAFSGVSRTGVHERPGFHHEVEHGLDARHVALLHGGSGLPQVQTTTTSPSACCMRSPENFVLPISHDEVVLREAVTDRQDAGRRVAAVRQRPRVPRIYVRSPGEETAVHGSEIGQYSEWNHGASIDWDLLNFEPHRKLQSLVRELNRLYAAEPSLYEVDFSFSGFEWIDFHDMESSVIIFARYSEQRKEHLIFACNFTPVPRPGYRIGVPQAGFYKEVFNTDSEMFGGSNVCNGLDPIATQPLKFHSRNQSIQITLPPLGVAVFKPYQPPVEEIASGD